MNARRAVVVALVWTLVVAAGSTLVWTVISGAGRDLVTTEAEVGSSGVAVETPGASGQAGVGSATSRTPRPSRPARTPSSATATSEAPPASGSAPPVSSSAPSTRPPGQPSPAPSSQAPPSSSPPSSSGTSTPSAAPRRGTWQGTAGTVVAECRGSVARLVGAQPNSGWSVEVKDNGPDRVEVRFEDRGDDHSGSGRVAARSGDDQVDVRAECVGGAPRFEVS